MCAKTSRRCQSNKKQNKKKRNHNDSAQKRPTKNTHRVRAPLEVDVLNGRVHDREGARAPHASRAVHHDRLPGAVRLVGLLWRLFAQTIVQCISITTTTTTTTTTGYEAHRTENPTCKLGHLQKYA